MNAFLRQKKAEIEQKTSGLYSITEYKPPGGETRYAIGRLPQPDVKHDYWNDDSVEVAIGAGSAFAMACTFIKGLDAAREC